MECGCSNFRASSLLLPCPPTASSRLSLSPSFSSNPRFSRLKRSELNKHRLVVRNVPGFDHNNEFPITPNKLFMQDAIGAEYGEGFETFGLDGPVKVDVDFLNERLPEGFLKRIRYAMKPDEAYGLIFSFDNVVADTRTSKLDCLETARLRNGYDRKFLVMAHWPIP